MKRRPYGISYDGTPPARFLTKYCLLCQKLDSSESEPNPTNKDEICNDTNDAKANIMQIIPVMNSELM